MKTIRPLILGFGLALAGAAAAPAQEFPGPDELVHGGRSVGFRLLSGPDRARAYFDGTVAAAGSGPVVQAVPRPMRVYLWYPAEPGSGERLKVESFVRMAAEDFGGRSGAGAELVLPVQLAKGVSRDKRPLLFSRSTVSVRDAAPLAGRHPLVLIGQGLYYESPLAFLVLSEHLASHGYVVATCPLLGSSYRLVNLNVPDLESLVRDLEFVLARALELPFVDGARVGLIGYDMGGMAAMVMAMRNPIIRAFLSLDCSILTPHPSGLPVSHPSYDLRNLTIPWMHVTQARAHRQGLAKSDPPTPMNRKPFGDNYLVLAKTVNHGAFTSYGWMGIEHPVPGYWGAVEQNLKAVGRAVCECGRSFFDGYLRGESSALARLKALDREPWFAEALASIERLEGRPAPPSQEEWIGRIIRDGMAAARPDLEAFRAAFPADTLFDENVLNWLGYHFLYWWGREEDAVGLFEWMTLVFPKSGNAFDSLGEAYAAVGRRDEAVAGYRRALELDPGNQNAKAALDRLTRKPPVRPRP